jgi:hypothetical protein
LFAYYFAPRIFCGRSGAPSPRRATNKKRYVAPDSDSDSDSLSGGQGFSDSGSGSFRGGWVIWIRIRVRFINQTKFRPLQKMGCLYNDKDGVTLFTPMQTFYLKFLVERRRLTPAAPNTD